ncbi:hypothetical protein WJX73_006620 [Symbiochloris irregularis]|uniref:ABC-2 type transporter transmembrane domain-containing protein n=1 Tax=Symbiochloris irregularis TaxID=706552 RepID=A0AAW1NLI4_9CHLO
MIAGLVYIRLPDNATSAQPRASTIFFLLMLNAITPISYMAFYVSDRKFFKMDSANGLYAPSAYYLSTVTAGSPFVIMNTIAGALMAYGLAGLRNDTRAIFIWMSIISLHALVSNQFLVTCIWLTPTQDTAYAIGSMYLTFSLLFCGFYVAVPNMVLTPLIGGAVPLCTTQGDAILSYLGLKLTIAQGALSLLGWYGLFHLTSFLALRRLYSKKDK